MPAHRAQGIAATHHAQTEFASTRRYPATINAPGPAKLGRGAAAVAGTEAVDADLPPSMAAGNFAFMLAAVPGAHVWIGNGPLVGGSNHHATNHRFNDDILPLGVQYFREVSGDALAQVNTGG